MNQNQNQNKQRRGSWALVLCCFGGLVAAPADWFAREGRFWERKPGFWKQRCHVETDVSTDIFQRTFPFSVPHRSTTLFCVSPRGSEVSDPRVVLDTNVSGMWRWRSSFDPTMRSRRLRRSKRPKTPNYPHFDPLMLRYTTQDELEIEGSAFHDGPRISISFSFSFWGVLGFGPITGSTPTTRCRRVLDGLETHDYARSMVPPAVVPLPTQMSSKRSSSPWRPSLTTL